MRRAGGRGAATALPVLLALAAAVTLTTARNASPAPAAPTAALASRPNVVFIMVDDMRNDDMRFMPQTRALIRDKGVRFRNSFAPFPLCCPSRASVLTGLYTHNHRVYSVQEDFGFHAFDDRATLGTMLQEAGYATVYVGKYLNRYGFDPPHTASSGNSLRYVPPGWSMWRGSLDGGFAPGSRFEGSTYDYFDTTLSFNGDGFESLQGRYQTRAYGEIARNVIARRAAGDQPFLLYLSFTAPHSGWPHEPDDPPDTRRDDGTVDEWHTPSRPRDVWGYWDRVVTASPGQTWRDPDFSDKPAYLRKLVALNAREWAVELEVTRQRAEALTVVDQQVGAIMRSLAATGELANTLVIFTSDNGYFLGEQHMRQGKIWPHEPSLRVPLLMRGAGLPAGVTRTDPFTSIDYLPTIATATGTTPPMAPDGISLWDVALHGDAGWKRAILTETGPLGFPPRDTNEAGLPLSSGGRRDIRFLIGIRTARYLYVDVAHQRDELYDLRDDPQQYRNLVDAPRYDEVQGLLAAELARVRACRGAACAAPMAVSLQRLP